MQPTRLLRRYTRSCLGTKSRQKTTYAIMAIVAVVIVVAWLVWAPTPAPAQGASGDAAGLDAGPKASSKATLDPVWRDLEGYQLEERGALGGSGPLALEAECQAACEAHPACAGFSWRQRDHSCWMQDDVVPLSKNAHVHTRLRVLPPKRVKAPALEAMWGWSAEAAAATRSETAAASKWQSEFEACLEAALTTTTKYTEPGLAATMPDHLQSELAAVESQFALMQDRAGSDPSLKLFQGKAELHVAYIQMFSLKFQAAKATLQKLLLAGSTSGDLRSHALRARSYVHEVAGQMRPAASSRDQAVNIEGAFNRTLDSYLGLGRIGYATGRTQAHQYGSCLIKLFAFRQMWTQWLARRPGRQAFDAIFAPVPIVTRGAAGFYLAAGADREELARARASFVQGDFAVLRELLTPWEVLMARNYFRACLKDVYGGHDPNLGRTSAYNDRINYFLNTELRPLIEHVIGFQVKPSYSFMCHYELYDNDPDRPELKAHTDRPDNEYTVSLQIYAHPEDAVWPIYVDKELTLPPESSWRGRPKKSDTVEAYMPLGDAIVFMGRVHNHWREQMPRSMQEFGSILFHFVHLEADLAGWNKH